MRKHDPHTKAELNKLIELESRLRSGENLHPDERILLDFLQRKYSPETQLELDKLEFLKKQMLSNKLSEIDQQLYNMLMDKYENPNKNLQ